MPRMISFALTMPQFIDGTKDVTRRQGWLHLKAGDTLMAVEKAMGLKKGEKVNKHGLIEIVSVRREVIESIDQADTAREGFPEMTPAEFVSFYCNANKCKPGDVCTRIEFKRLNTKEMPCLK